MVVTTLVFALFGCGTPHSGTRTSTTTSQLATPTEPPGNAVFVNCVTGGAGNPGTEAEPLRDIGEATARTLESGTTLWLARGCVWDGQVVLAGAGTPDAPITLAAYGTGPAPALTGTSLETSQAVLRLTGAHLTARDIRVSHAAGTGVELAGDHCALNAIEIEDVGLGVVFSGAFGSADRVEVHDLHMVVDSPGGVDDYGAVGFVVEAPDVEISYSRCVNCRAPSPDFGFDGGFVEIWNHGDRLLVHDSSGLNTQGILEVGGKAADGSALGVQLRDNTFQDSHGGVWIHGEGPFALPAASISMLANTISATSSSDPVVLGGDLRNLVFRENRVSTPGQVSWSGPPASHVSNIFFVATPEAVGYQLDQTETTVVRSAVIPPTDSSYWDLTPGPATTVSVESA